MARASFDAFWPLLLEEEGGFDDDPRDPGNWTGGQVNVGRLVGTKYGIDAASHWRECDIPSLTPLQAKAIYLRSYANPVRFDDLPAGVDVMVVDTAINQGPHKASIWLQEAVGANPDGAIGPKTIAAARVADPVATIAAIADRREAHYRSLSTFVTFGRGWLNRINMITALADKLAKQGAHA